jgi:hypothetical protein
VDGLELPNDLAVNYDEGFVTIEAKCKGSVKWLVLSGVKIKYFTLPTSNTIIVSIPPQSALVTIFAVGQVDNKLTDFAKMTITVNGPTGPTPGPGPGPNPTPISGPKHVTFVVDLNNTSPALAQILNSQKVREAITTRNSFYRLYDAQSPVLKEKGLAKIVSDSGGPPLIIIQDNQGNVRAKQRIPNTEAEVIQYLSQVLGGN